MLTQDSFTHYALMQNGYAIYGCGKTPEEARESAALWLDNGFKDADKALVFNNMSSMQRVTMHGDLVIVPCTKAVVDTLLHILEWGGGVEWEETRNGICMKSDYE